MTKSDIEVLKANIDRRVRVHCRDGEIFVGKALFVSEEEQDLTYDLISTTKESQYEKADQQPCYLIRFQDIAAVELYEES
jgi:hypothetical protein